MTVRSPSVVRAALGGAVICAVALAVSAPALAGPPDDRTGDDHCLPAEAGLVDSLLRAPSCIAAEATADEPVLPLPSPEAPRVLDPGTILEPDLPELPGLDDESNDEESDPDDDEDSDSDDDEESESGSDDESDSGSDGSGSGKGGESGSTDGSDDSDGDDEDTGAAADGTDAGPTDTTADAAEDSRRDSGADSAVGSAVLPGVGDAVSSAASAGLDWTGALAADPEQPGSGATDRADGPGDRSDDPAGGAESTARVDPRALTGPAEEAPRTAGRAAVLPLDTEPTGEPAAVAFAEALPSPAEMGRNPGAVLPSLLLTLLLLAVLALPASAVNRAAGEHAERLDTLLARLRAPHTGAGTAVGPLAAAVAVTAVAGAIMLGFLAPAFPFDASAPALVLGLVVAFVVVTVAQQGAQLLYVGRWWGVRCHLMPFPGFLLLGAFSVVLSRAVGLEPGLVLGTLVAFGAARPLRADEEGPAAALAATALTAAGGLAWILRDPLTSAVGAPGTFLPTALGVALAAITVAAVTNLVFALVPVSFLPGAALLRWSPALWAVFACLGGFAFVHLVARPAADDLAGRAGLLAVLLGVYLLAAGALWYWLRRADGPAQRPDRSDAEPVTESINVVSAVSTAAAPRPSAPVDSIR